MVADVSSLLEFHIVDLSWGLHPLEPISVAELHSVWHHFEPKINERIFG